MAEPRKAVVTVQTLSAEKTPLPHLVHIKGQGKRHFVRRRSESLTKTLLSAYRMEKLIQ
ncbi:MAG: hypothetical protein AB1461_09170 [Thermodesulfobacteriota bacterium]